MTRLLRWWDQLTCLTWYVCPEYCCCQKRSFLFSCLPPPVGLCWLQNLLATGHVVTVDAGRQVSVSTIETFATLQALKQSGDASSTSTPGAFGSKVVATPFPVARVRLDGTGMSRLPRSCLAKPFVLSMCVRVDMAVAPPVCASCLRAHSNDAPWRGKPHYTPRRWIHAPDHRLSPQDRLEGQWLAVRGAVCLQPQLWPSAGVPPRRLERVHAHAAPSYGQQRVPCALLCTPPDRGCDPGRVATTNTAAVAAWRLASTGGAHNPPARHVGCLPA